jgi:hypothetical protein
MAATIAAEPRFDNRRGALLYSGRERPGAGVFLVAPRQVFAETGLPLARAAPGEIANQVAGCAAGSLRCASPWPGRVEKVVDKPGIPAVDSAGRPFHDLEKAGRSMIDDFTNAHLFEPEPDLSYSFAKGGSKKKEEPEPEPEPEGDAEESGDAEEEIDEGFDDFDDDLDEEFDEEEVDEDEEFEEEDGDEDFEEDAEEEEEEEEEEDEDDVEEEDFLDDDEDDFDSDEDLDYDSFDE